MINSVPFENYRAALAPSILGTVQYPEFGEQINLWGGDLDRFFKVLEHLFTQASGKIIVFQGTSSYPHAVLISGDAEMDSAGVLSIAADAITTVKIADGQVTSAKLDTDIAVAGNLSVGAEIKVTEGTDASMGVATLVAGTVTVNTAKVTASSRIFLTHQNSGGTPGFVIVSARSAGTSFTILSSSATDTSDIAWLIVEPA